MTEVHPTTQLLFDALGPALNRDADGQPNEDLLHWLDGTGHLLGRIDDLVRGEDGWVWLLDPTAAPREWLGWLAQFVGVRLADGLSESAQRARIIETSGQRRGTVAAIRGAARQHLAGSRLVQVEERTDGDGQPDPYHLRVTTFTAETPDPDGVEAALRAEKPAGLVLHYRVLEGITLQQLFDEFATLADLDAAFATLEQMAEHIPAQE